MKKKIILLAAALMMFMGIVSASSINGDYKGNPIVKVISNGKQLESDEVPAIIYDGHTVVPISLLRQIGASVEWNQDTYSVDIKLPAGTAIPNTTSSNNTGNSMNIKLFVKAAKDTLSGMGISLDSYTFNIDEDGAFINVEITPPKNLSNQEFENLFVTIATSMTALNFDIDGMVINSPNVLTAVIRFGDAKKFVNGSISQKNFIDLWKIEVAQSPQITPSTGSQTPVQSNNQAMCNLISDNYKRSIDELKVSLGRRGIGNSSSFDTGSAYLIGERNKELTKNGCSIK